MDALEGPYYSLCQNYLRALGLWPFQDPRTKLILRTLMLTSCLTVMIPYVSIRCAQKLEFLGKSVSFSS